MSHIGPLKSGHLSMSGGSSRDASTSLLSLGQEDGGGTCQNYSGYLDEHEAATSHSHAAVVSQQELMEPGPAPSYTLGPGPKPPATAAAGGSTQHLDLHTAVVTLEPVISRLYGAGAGPEYAVGAGSLCAAGVWCGGRGEGQPMERGGCNTTECDIMLCIPA